MSFRSAIVVNGELKCGGWRNKKKKRGSGLEIERGGEGRREGEKQRLTSQATCKLTGSPVSATWPKTPTPQGTWTSLSLPLLLPPGRRKVLAPLWTSKTLETNFCRPPLCPSTRKRDAPSVSRRTAKLSTVWSQSRKIPNGKILTFPSRRFRVYCFVPCGKGISGPVP